MKNVKSSSFQRVVLKRENTINTAKNTMQAIYTKPIFGASYRRLRLLMKQIKDNC